MNWFLHIQYLNSRMSYPSQSGSQASLNSEDEELQVPSNCLPSRRTIWLNKVIHHHPTYFCQRQSGLNASSSHTKDKLHLREEIAICVQMSWNVLQFSPLHPAKSWSSVRYGMIVRCRNGKKAVVDTSTAATVPRRHWTEELKNVEFSCVHSNVHSCWICLLFQMNRRVSMLRGKCTSGAGLRVSRPVLNQKSVGAINAASAGANVQKDSWDFQMVVVDIWMTVNVLRDFIK